MNTQWCSLVVAEELDRKKTRMDEIGANARSAIRLLEELGASMDGGLRQPVDLPGGGSVRIEISGIASVGDPRAQRLARARDELEMAAVNYLRGLSNHWRIRHHR